MLAGLIAACAVPAVAAAQQVISSVDVQSTQLRYSDTLDATAAGITPSLQLGWNNAALSASGTYAQLAHAWSADGSIDASVFTPSLTRSSRALFAEFSGTLGGSTRQDGARTGSAIAAGRLHLDGNRIGAWLGAGGGATSDGLKWRGVRQGEAGAWVENGPAALTLTAQPTAVDDSIRYTDLAAELSWRGSVLELGAVAVTRAGSHLPSFENNANAWASVNAAAWLLPRVALLASAGTYPVDYTQGFPGGRFVSAGIRIALTPRQRLGETAPKATIEPIPAATGIIDLRLDGAAGHSQTLRMRAPSARSMEVSGDFTAWQPRAMTRGADGWFSLDTPLAPGTYQMNVRLDGGKWLPPPSLTTVQDEFGGSAGVLVIP
jgi:hypothetical protein